LTAAASGRKASIGECLSRAGPRVLTVAGIRLVTDTLGGLALVLLIVPGLLAYSRWFVAIPAALFERQGVRTSLARSAWLTRQDRGLIAACYAALAVAVVVLWLGIVQLWSLFAAQLGKDSVWLLRASVQLVPATAASLVYLASAVAYLELRSTDDGETLASVFD
jgi:hypothetical protein